MVAVQEVLNEAPFGMRQLAQKDRENYETIGTWNIGKGEPRVESLIRLAGGLKKR